jgi:hypothetical protein
LDSLGANAGIRGAVKNLFDYIAQYKGIQLQFVAFSDLTGDTVIADAACQLYAIVAKKQATATDAFLKAVDHATTAAGSTFFLCVELADSAEQIALVFPNGIPQSAGITLVSSTTDTGTTDTTTGDGPNGFCIIGAA